MVAGSLLLAGSTPSKVLDVGRPVSGPLARGHVDTLVGQARLYNDFDGRRLVLGVDSFGEAGGADGRVDHVFLFGMLKPFDGPPSRKGRARVSFWPEGLRVEFPEEKLTFDLILQGATPPPALGKALFHLTEIKNGTALVHQDGPDIEALSLDDLDPGAFSGPIMDDDGGPLPAVATPGCAA